MTAKLNGNNLSNPAGNINGTPNDDSLINFTDVTYDSIDLGAGFDVLRLFNNRSVGTSSDFFDMGAADAEWFITGSGTYFIDASSSDEGVTITSYGKTTAIGSDFDDELKAIGGGINGTSEPQDFDGGGGNDKITGAGGDDELAGGAGNDTIAGRGGNDTIFGNQGNDEMDGGAGDDDMFGGKDNDTIDGGAGNDNLNGNKGNDDILGGDGNDELYGDEGSDKITGGDGDDLIYGGSEFIDKDDAADTLDGGDGDDEMYGNAGNDEMDGGAGDDDMFGGEGDDDMSGGGGNDMLHGGKGDDKLNGGGGVNKLYGGAGNDRIINFDDDDIVDAGEGRDTLRLFNSRSIGTEDNFFDMAAANAEWFITGRGTNFITAENDDTGVTITSYGKTTAIGSKFDDELKALSTSEPQDFKGRGGDDKITGAGGGDTLRGDGGDDKINGRGGDDRLVGGDGDDVLTGGAGADTFQFDDRDNNNNGGKTPLDVIKDFEFGVDIATFRYDGGFFGGSNQTSFSTEAEFNTFLSQVKDNGGSVTQQSNGVRVDVFNPANNRTLDYLFEGVTVVA